ncbi:response regulator transcription factor [Rhodothermus profundi]|uniref:Transcriptional regulatory protein, C terminal n=1 Tax=Rhodothermus profundi TaxID=633813 RepID=A0A1M6SS04_9BACT|nr:response regulator transcription factor [Rhodothermus profundi]SHK47378.1 Transcriptional regulatory protein, C terminal [Rhodothermus profundi]
MWILLVEDDERLARALARGLREEGYQVDRVADGLEAEARVQASTYDALIVDWRLPRMDGQTLVRRLRQAGYQMPILMLTALDDLEHRVAGLDAGADDYLGKPFAFEELLARLRALLRRAPVWQPSDLIRVGPLEINERRRQARIGDQVLPLRPKEYDLLRFLARHPGEVLSRTRIAEQVWGDPFYVSDNTIDVTVSGLRQKLSEATPALQIETVRGVGYALRVSSEEMFSS